MENYSFKNYSSFVKVLVTYVVAFFLKKKVIISARIMVRDFFSSLFVSFYEKDTSFISVLTLNLFTSFLLTLLNRMEYPILINWTSPFRF